MDLTFNNIKPPCAPGCEERHPGCHDSCAKYRKYRERLDELKEAALKTKGKDAELLNYKRERKDKALHDMTRRRDWHLRGGEK